MDPRVFELFAFPPSEFTAARNALAATLKKEGDAARSKEIKALARPTPSAWAVNALFRTQGDAFNALLAVGADLRKFASASLRGEGGVELRAAQRTQSERVAALKEQGVALLVASGQPATAATLERLGRSLQAISSRGSFAPYEAGCLCADVEPPSFDELASIVGGDEPSIAQAPATAHVPEPPPSSTRLKQTPKPSEADAKRRAEARAAAEEALNDAKNRLESVSREASALMTRLSELREATRTAKANVEAAREAERQAIAAEGDANERAAGVVRSLESAKADVAKAQSALDELERT